MMFQQDILRNNTICYLKASRSLVPESEHWLTPAELEVLRSLSFRKRRHDWLLGRWTAKSALSLLARPQSVAFNCWQILASEDGAPDILLNGEPVETSISLSHSAGLAFCALAGNRWRMGCDLEKIAERSLSFEETFFTPCERGLLKGISKTRRDSVVTLIWSAKESVLKALRTGLRSDTRRIRITSIEAGSNGQWCRFRAEDSFNYDRFNGWWQESDRMIYTIASDGPSSEPSGL